MAGPKTTTKQYKKVLGTKTISEPAGRARAAIAKGAQVRVRRSRAAATTSSPSAKVALSGAKTGRKPASTMRSHPYGPPAGKKRAGAVKAAPAGSKDARAAHAASVKRDYPAAAYRTRKRTITKTTIQR